MGIFLISFFFQTFGNVRGFPKFSSPSVFLKKHRHRLFLGFFFFFFYFRHWWHIRNYSFFIIYLGFPLLCGGDGISKLSSFLFLFIYLFFIYKSFRHPCLYGGATLGSEMHPYKCTVTLFTSGLRVAYVLVNEATDSFVLYKGEEACSLAVHAHAYACGC